MENRPNYEIQNYFTIEYSKILVKSLKIRSRSSTEISSLTIFLEKKFCDLIIDTEWIKSKNIFYERIKSYIKTADSRFKKYSIHNSEFGEYIQEYNISRKWENPNFANEAIIKGMNHLSEMPIDLISFDRNNIGSKIDLEKCKKNWRFFVKEFKLYIQQEITKTSTITALITRNDKKEEIQQNFEGIEILKSQVIHMPEMKISQIIPISKNKVLISREVKVHAIN